MFDKSGGMFDLNGDGKVSADEEFLAFLAFNEAMRRDSDDSDGCDDYGDDSEEL